MRKLTQLLASVVLAAGLATQAGAASLEVSSGTLTLEVGALPPVSIPLNPGTTLFVDTGINAGDFIADAGIFGPETIPLPRSLFTGVPQISGLTLAGFGNGSIFWSPAASPASPGIGSLAGDTIVNVLQLINLTIPLSVVGIPGDSVQAGAGSIIITVIGQGWTDGTAAVVVEPGNTVTRMGGDDRTPNFGGPITLVTGFQAITNVAGTLPGFATMRLDFVPEPGALLAFGSCAAALVVLGRRRMRK